MSASSLSAPIRKAIFPVAGIGSRFLPLTLAVPKEMIPIIDTPLLHFAVSEALEAGVEECIFVVAPERGQRRVIEDYFCDNGALERRLESAGKGGEAARWRGLLPRPKRVRFVEQAAPLGLGHAIFSARECIEEEPFAVLLPDELLRGTPGCLASLVFAASGACDEVLLAMREVSAEACRNYGILDLDVSGDSARRNTFFSRPQSHPDLSGISPRREGSENLPPRQAVRGVVEKPAAGAEPSRMAIIGRYILPPSIFPLLQPRGALRGGEETPLTDALGALMAGGAPCFGLRFDGERYDCGSKEGFLAATFALAKEGGGVR